MNLKDKIIEFLNHKKILILGYGREGQSMYQFLRNNLIDYQIGIADQNPITLDLDTDVSIYTGDNYLDATQEYDIVIKSPGIVIKDLLSEDEKAKITSITDLFLRFCQNIIIGVTGTKGKSTTASLIYHILKQNGKDVLLVGNIGIAAINVIDQIKNDTILVYELSCHQLEYVKASPHISVLINVYEEHLDHYKGIKEYVQCKKNVYKYQQQEDYLIYGDVGHYISSDDLENIPSSKIDLNNNQFGIDRSCIKTSLIGEHNKKNIEIAIIVSQIMGISQKDAMNAVESFCGLEHRLEYVGNYSGIQFYNDSIATAQEAVIQAVESLKKVDTIIVGGMDRGLNYRSLVEFLSTSSVKNILLLPNTADRISKLWKCYGNTEKKIVEVEDMRQAVQLSYELTRPGKICLLSPAAASYGFYLNFEKRGDDFKKLVREYGSKA